MNKYTNSSQYHSSKQAGNIVLVLLLAVALTAGLWAYMRWSNHTVVESLTSDIDQLNSSLEDKGQSIERLEGENQRLMAELAEAQSNLQEQNTSFIEKERGIQTNLDNLSTRFNQQQLTVEALNRSLEGKDAEIIRLQTEITQKKASIDTLEADNSKVSSQLDSLSANIDSLKTELEARDQQISSLEQQLTSVGQYSEQLNQQYTQVQGQLENEIERSQSYSQQLESLEEQFSREQDALAKLEQEINQYRLDNKSLQQENSSLQDNNQQLDDEKRQIIQRFENGISIIRLPNRILFDTGSAQLNRQGRDTLAIVASTLKTFPQHLISVQGHTDHRPIGSVLSDRYPSNWELSSARAASAIRILVDEGIPADQFQVVGYADTRPIVDKADAEQLSQNRRIEILLFPPASRRQQAAISQ